MSLINEALKRTRDAGYQPTQTSPSVAPGYRLESEPNARRLKPLLLVMGAIGTAVLAGILVVALWVVPHVRNVEKGLTSGNGPSMVETKSSTPAARPIPGAETPANAEVPPPVSPQAPVTTPPSDTKGSEDQIVAKVMERIKAEQPSSPVTPQLVLQGITYAPDNRDAMINGVTVHEGEVIEGARVVTIESQRVTLDFNGREIILRMP